MAQLSVSHSLQVQDAPDKSGLSHRPTPACFAASPSNGQQHFGV